MKLAFVVPRYGPDIVGGAETGARGLAEHLVALAGWDVEVFTTCATDARTWADDREPGTETVRGVRVHRFRSLSGRAPDFDDYSTPLLVNPGAVGPEAEAEWFRRQGPVCPEAVEAALASDAELIVGYPYLYWPIVEVARRGGRRVILHPAAHDEPPLFLPGFRRTFAGVGGLVYHTDAERRLLEAAHPVAHVPHLVLGLGVDGPAAPPDPARAREALDLGDRPLLVAAGRVDPGKGTHTLVRWFDAYRRRRGSGHLLVLIGPVEVPPPQVPGLVVAGPVPEQLKWDVMAAADALVTLSPNESFSIVMCEAWLAGTPTIVNAHCGATAEHIRASGGGVAVSGYAEFEVAVDLLSAGEDLRRRLAEAGRRYTLERFAWPRLVDRYRTWMLDRARFAGPGGR